MVSINDQEFHDNMFPLVRRLLSSNMDNTNYALYSCSSILLKDEIDMKSQQGNGSGMKTVISVSPIPTKIDAQEIVEASIVRLEEGNQPLAQCCIHFGIVVSVIWFVVACSQLNFGRRYV